MVVHGSRLYNAANSPSLLGSLAQSSFQGGVEIATYLGHTLIAILAEERRRSVVLENRTTGFIFVKLAGGVVKTPLPVFAIAPHVGDAPSWLRTRCSCFGLYQRATGPGLGSSGPTDRLPGGTRR
jgi:hypothetical protein